MIRIIAFLVFVIVVSAAAAWFADNPGTVTVDWLGRRLEAPVAVPLMAVAGLVLMAAVGYRLWRWWRGVPSALRSGLAARGRRQGSKAVVTGLTLAAAGDRDGAAKQTRLAAKHRPADDPLALLVAAASAGLEGDEHQVMAAAEALADHPETELAGLLGLIREGRARGQARDYQALAARAVGIAPGNAAARALALELKVEDGDWDGAAAALKALAAAKGIDKSQAARARAMMLSAQAVAVAGQDRDHALGLALKAHKASPGFTPGAVVAAQLCAASGEPARARRILAAAWAGAPHPMIAGLFSKLHGDDTPTERMARMERLCADNQDHFESRLALAKHALDAQLHGLARHHLTTLLGQTPCARGYGLAVRLAEAEPGPEEGADDPRLSWQLLADQAPDAAWECDNCHRRWAEWRLSCGHCQAVAAMTWRLAADGPRASELPAPDRPHRQIAPPPAAPGNDLYRSLAEGEARDADERAGQRGDEGTTV